MSKLFYLSVHQLDVIRPYFPLSHGIARVDDLRVISGIIYVLKHGLQWRDAPVEYGPYKTVLYVGAVWEFLIIFLANCPRHPVQISSL